MSYVKPMEKYLAFGPRTGSKYKLHSRSLFLYCMIFPVLTYNKIWRTDLLLQLFWFVEKIFLKLEFIKYQNPSVLHDSMFLDASGKKAFSKHHKNNTLKGVTIIRWLNGRGLVYKMVSGMILCTYNKIWNLCWLKKSTLVTKCIKIPKNFGGFGHNFVQAILSFR
jgi:hypothetical protein